MKIVFVYPAHTCLSFEYLSAIAKSKGHDVSLAFDPALFNDSYVSIRSLSKLFSIKNKLVAEIASCNPDLIAFSVVSRDYEWFREMGRMIRSKSAAPIIAGNIHITSVPEQVLKLDFVSAVVRGEGELAFAELLDSLEQGNIDNNIRNVGIFENGAARLNPLRPLIQDLDSLPFPDKDLFETTSMKSKDVYSTMTSRGCPFKCSYCNNNLMKNLYSPKGYVRQRSVDNVIEELKIAREKYGATHVDFLDEVFGLNKKWLGEFVEKYNRHIALPYITYTHTKIVDEEYAGLMKESGCRKLEIGVQTINEEKRRRIYNRSESTEEIRLAITILQKNGLLVAADNIINFPTESESDLIEMVSFYNETRPDILKVFWLCYFPGTEIVNIALRHGVIDEATVARINSGELANFVSVNTKTTKLHRKFYLLLVLTQILPRNWIRFLVKHRLYRLIPASAIPEFTYSIWRLLLRKNSDAETMMLQIIKRYKFYIKRFFFRA